MLVVLAAFFVVAALIPILAGRLGNRIFYLTALVPIGAFAVVVLAAPTVLAGGVLTEGFQWIPTLNLEFALRLDTLSWVFALVVTGIGALVLLYCPRYFTAHDPSVGRFAAHLTAFAGAMFGLVLADDLYLMFIFWEATSVFSYLLIGHYNDRIASRGAALQALLVTTAGGLVMLVGVVILAVQSGTTLISEIIAEPPSGGIITVAVMLMLVGAISKSALVPFHFWLPAAMAAPTPVSAYLHAAAMVKAGIYLIARFAPGFATTPGWQEVVILLGVLTMLVGGWRALKQHDLKLLLAYGTVSQLGFLTVVTGYGVSGVALAGLALVFAHALFKSTLFLVVGIIDRNTGTRDLRKLSGLGGRHPALVTVAVLAAASMAAIPPTLGFVAKEGVFTALIDEARSGRPLSQIALYGLIAGSILTTAYTARFLWGAFASKQDVVRTPYTDHGRGMFVAPTTLAAAGVAFGFLTPQLNHWLSGYSDTLPPGATAGAELVLWHGLSPAFGVSMLVLAAGLGLFWMRDRVYRLQSRVPALVDAGRGYWVSMRTVDRVAARTTAITQSGSLPAYLGVILMVLLGTVGFTVIINRSWPPTMLPFDHPAQVPIVVAMVVAAVGATRATKRFTAVLLLGITGYGLAALFALQGAPDLALTQVLVETVTLIAFVLVLRRLPIKLGAKHGTAFRVGRAVLAASVGVLMAVVVMITLGVRSAQPISLQFPALAYELGHGRNVVNVTLVDIRGWDTMGEISVLVVAATGIASLIFIKQRTGSAPRLAEDEGRRGLRARLKPLTEPASSRNGGAGDAPDGDQAPSQRTWLLAGWTLAPHNRSIVLEVVVRLLFHSAIVLSIYLLFVGHNLPGGGFSGGLLAGLALAARYLAGGRFELGAAVSVDAGKVLGFGLLLAVGTATVPLFFGMNPLESAWWEGSVPLLGHLEFGTTTIFDFGVYLIVVGLIIDVLRSLGAEVDRQQEEHAAIDSTGPIMLFGERSTR
ncbi:Na+/H+ antiporter subunit A [Homoserinimonas sp. OAct 916]|uniref:Na+/H+ antiporter subunit A n=1 Tax=Homoserinimonas sp. OAct 916 TaxID=2211450 RepID=UPI000DBE8405|nr:Na+/H+ antiporter subunit A [Homoserinimonas sp. OAct 916]